MFFEITFGAIIKTLSIGAPRKQHHIVTAKVASRLQV